MALRSASGCAATLDGLMKLRLADADQTYKGRELLIRVVSMLTRLAQQQRSR